MSKDKEIIQLSQTLTTSEILETQSSTNDITHFRKLLTIKIISDTLIHNPRADVKKQDVYSIYTTLFGKLTNTTPLNQAQLGKLVKLYFGCRSKRVGSRGDSQYAYYGISLVPELEIRLSKQKECKFDGKNVQRESVVRWLMNEVIENDPILEKCQLIFNSFKEFDFKELRSDWQDINYIVKFKIIDIFNELLNHGLLKKIGIVYDPGMNTIKVNIIIKIIEQAHEYKNNELSRLEIQYLTCQILQELTIQNKSTFGFYWIIKCLFDELTPYIINLLITT